jgi:hypothetical protein
MIRNFGVGFNRSKQHFTLAIEGGVIAMRKKYVRIGRNQSAHIDPFAPNLFLRQHELLVAGERRRVGILDLCEVRRSSEAKDGQYAADAQ